jgi:hypothetical protein
VVWRVARRHIRVLRRIPHDVADPDNAALQDFAVEAGAVDQVFGDRLAGDLLEMPARLHKPGPLQQCLAEPEVAADQVVQRHAFDRHIAPVLFWAEVDPGVALECNQRLKLEQGELRVLRAQARIPGYSRLARRESANSNLDGLLDSIINSFGLPHTRARIAAFFQRALRKGA